MSKEIVNLKNVTKVKFKNKTVCDDFEFLPYRKTLFNKREEGFYRTEWSFSQLENQCVDLKCYNKEDIEKLNTKKRQYLVENNKVYHKSCIKITLKNDKKIYKFFDNDKSAKKWYNDNLKPLIKNPIEI